MAHAWQRELAGLAANLRARSALDLTVVAGDRQTLERLAALGMPEAQPAAPPEPAPAHRQQAPARQRPAARPTPHCPHPPDARQTPPDGGRNVSGRPPVSLAQVRVDMGECRRCRLAQGRGHIVFGQGPADARVMIIGEGPGAEEDRRGLPFVGPAGQLLDRMLAAIGLDRAQVYITNIVKCRPPGNRDPQGDEVAACLPFLEAQIAAIDPEVIVTLGRPATQTLLGASGPLGALRGKWQEAHGRPLLPTYHPAFLLRSPEKKAEAWADLKTLRRRLAQPRA